jgi:hypothetical protein
MSKLLLVPSARLIPSELQTDFGAIPSGMVPLNSRPALHYIISPYAQSGFRTIVATHEKGELIQAFLESNRQLNARATDVGPTASLGETVLRALNVDAPGAQQLVVNFGDTYVGDPLPSGDFVYYQRLNEVYRWTKFQLTNDGRMGELIEKEEAWEPSAVLAFVGVFGIRDKEAFTASLEAALLAPRGATDPFYIALRQYLNDRTGRGQCYYMATDWRDFGHLDTYYQTKSEFFLGARSFNSVRVDTGRGILIKKSRNEKKLRSEIRWYQSLPGELQHLAPRVFRSCTEPGNTFVEMEFYGYPPLSDVYLFGDWDRGVWQRAFRAIGLTLREMRAVRLDDPPPHLIREALRSMYETKTMERLSQIESRGDLKPFFQDRLTINGVECAGIPTVLEQLPSVLAEAGVLDERPFTLIHGDLCLSNILYDRRNGFARLVDPRGAFGEFESYGDSLYDVAKLSHSLVGDYDLLVNGMFTLRMGGTSVALRVSASSNQLRAKAVFAEWVKSNYEKDLRLISLIEGLLFLSMVPLHQERPASQAAFLAQGLLAIGRLNQGWENLMVKDEVRGD